LKIKEILRKKKSKRKRKQKFSMEKERETVGGKIGMT
jgi:hypothetical protein